MPSQHPQDIEYGHVIKRYVTRKDSDRPRHLELGSGFLRPGWPHRKRFTRKLIEDAATITDAELEALFAYEWRSRLTAAWLVGVGTPADAEILATYLDRYLPLTDLQCDFADGWTQP
ncbi:DUF6000 family protein [Streptomyces sp. 4.24]|uniref:DUF6000 family protein n=1 Tax=Streptomyces tritrimontium TaxID=3406573 RepID=UPI003BB7D365